MDFKCFLMAIISFSLCAGPLLAKYYIHSDIHPAQMLAQKDYIHNDIQAAQMVAQIELMKAIKDLNKKDDKQKGIWKSFVKVSQDNINKFVPHVMFWSLAYMTARAVILRILALFSVDPNAPQYVKFAQFMNALWGA